MSTPRWSQTKISNVAREKKTEEWKQMAGLQRFWCWQDAELEKLTFIGLYSAATVGPGWITPYSPSPLPSSLRSTFQLKLFLPFPSPVRLFFSLYLVSFQLKIKVPRKAFFLAPIQGKKITQLIFNQTNSVILLALCLDFSILHFCCSEKLKVKPSPCLWSTSNVTCTQNQCGFGSSVGFYLGLSSLNWELARLRIAIWVIIIGRLQGMVPVSLLHRNILHHSAGKRPLGFSSAHTPIAVCFICSAQTLRLPCAVHLVQSSQDSRRCNVCLLRRLALKCNIS